jgi:hypothetical protein
MSRRWRGRRCVRVRHMGVMRMVRMVRMVHVRRVWMVRVVHVRRVRVAAGAAGRRQFVAAQLGSHVLVLLDPGQMSHLLHRLTLHDMFSLASGSLTRRSCGVGGCSTRREGKGRCLLRNALFWSLIFRTTPAMATSTVARTPMPSLSLLTSPTAATSSP